MSGSCCGAIASSAGRRPSKSFARWSRRSPARRNIMARILWLNWSGGGNLPPSLGIARALTESAHEVCFAGRAEMVPRVERAGFRAIELTRAYEQASRYPQKWLQNAASFLTSPAVAEEIRSVAAAEKPDLAVIDAMFPAALC